MTVTIRKPRPHSLLANAAFRSDNGPCSGGGAGGKPPGSASASSVASESGAVLTRTVHTPKQVQMSWKNNTQKYLLGVGVCVRTFV
eukprot:364834-Chlamydomonas_euryale.AAC.7